MTAIADQRILPPRFTPLRFEALKAQAEANVDARRRKLAAKLHAEELALQNELVANQVTPEERRAALERRAVDLVRRREEERVAFAEQMLYRQWRDGCDGVRQGDSNAQLRAALEGRSSQLEEKAAARETAAREHAAFEVMYEAERLKKEERHAREIADIKKKADEAVRVLDQQVAENRKLRAEKAEAAKREVEEMKSQWAAEEARHDADIAAKLAKNMRIGEDLKAFKAARQAELAAIKEREEAIDRELLEEAMRQKAEEEAREAELKERKKEQDAIYRTHLAALLQKDGEDESERDRLVAEQQALYEAKRQAEKDRAEAARAKLMAEVHADRERQLAQHAVAREMAAEAKITDKLRMREEVAEMEAVEEEHKARVHAQRIKNRLDIEAQIQYKDSLARKQKEDARQAWEDALQAEKDYQSMIDFDAAQARPAVPNYGRKSTAWYH